MPKKIIPPLILEEVQASTNYLYLTMIEYKKERYLVIIDNIQGSDIKAFVLDHAAAEGIDVKNILSISNLWYYKASDRYPLSFEFARLGIKDQVAPILRTFNLDHVTRMIGKIFVYDIDTKPKVKRKRANLIPGTVEIKLKKNRQEQSSFKSGDFVDM